MSEHTFSILELVLTFITSMIASSGLWAYITARQNKNDLSRKLLIGLAHDRITFLCMRYIRRGCITEDEYDNLCTYLWEPYKEIGGIKNGIIIKLMQDVEKLPIQSTDIQKDSTNENVK